MRLTLEFIASFLFVYNVYGFMHGFGNTWNDKISLLIATLIVTLILWLLTLALFSTKFLHFTYWILRSLGLRKKAQGKLVKNKDGSIGIKIDKLDPGEKFDTRLILIPMNKENKKFIAKLKKEKKK